MQIKTWRERKREREKEKEKEQALDVEPETLSSSADLGPVT